MYVDPMGYSAEKFWLQFVSWTMITVGAVCMFVPGAQILGLGLIGAGVGSLIGGEVSEAMGGSYLLGWGVGGVLGAFGGQVLATASSGFLSAGFAFGSGFTLSGAGGLAITSITVTGAQMVGSTVLIGTAGVMLYAGKRIAPRINSNTKKGAYEKAFQKGGKTKPIGPEDHGQGPHYHPNVPNSSPYRHWHYYFQKSIGIIFFGLLNEGE